MAAPKGVPHLRSTRRDSSWEHAACADANPRIFFDPNRYTEALQFCAHCPVKKPCSQLGRGAGEGVWGGKAHYPPRKGTRR